MSRCPLALVGWPGWGQGRVARQGGLPQGDNETAQRSLPWASRRLPRRSMASATGGVTGENKKGEVNELKASLRNPAIDRDPEKKREVIKRVIAYMTLGIDVSKLFSEMIMVRRALPPVLGLGRWSARCPQSAERAPHCSAPL